MKISSVMTVAWIIGLVSKNGLLTDGFVLSKQSYTSCSRTCRRQPPPRQESSYYRLELQSPKALGELVDSCRSKCTNSRPKALWGLLSKGSWKGGIASLLLMGGIILFPSSSAFAIETTANVGNLEYLSITEKDIQIQSNKKLIDYAVGTVNTQFYDNSGGAKFNPSDFYKQWKDLQKTLLLDPSHAPGEESVRDLPSSLRLDTRDGTVDTLRYLVRSLKDPYSKYMTREELLFELKGSHDGFLGTGAYIEVPSSTAGTISTVPSSSRSSSGSLQNFRRNNHITDKETFRMNIARESLEKKTNMNNNSKKLLTNTKVANLPVVTAIAPNSPAERAGLVVGDKIVAVGDKDTFVGYGRDEIRKCLEQNWGYNNPRSITGSSSSSSSSNQEQQQYYFGIADLTIAKPVYSSTVTTLEESPSSFVGDDSNEPSVETRNAIPEGEIVVGYRSTKVKLPTKASDGFYGNGSNEKTNLKGDSVVQYQLLTLSPSSGSIFGNPSGFMVSSSSDNKEDASSIKCLATESKVGYIRLTRFSRSSTQGYLQAIQALEEEGAQSYVIDLRNNYGGVIQEAMLTASTLIGDQHALLCYLLNARGGFTPVDVESYVVDPKYPGYLLSKESKFTVLEQVMKERPEIFRKVRDDGAGGATTIRGDHANTIGTPLLNGQGGKRILVDWDPPSSYASIHEQVAKRGIHRISYADYSDNSSDGKYEPYRLTFVNHDKAKSKTSASSIRQRQLLQRSLQKDVVLLINEGTASSAEFFTAALQDNGRSLAVVGTKSFGKGLIQHTFPMPDGGGLKLTIGEFLRPSLQHVTNPFWDSSSLNSFEGSATSIGGGGGIRPDVYCDSKQGIPGNPKADLCVGVALDLLEEAKSTREDDDVGTAGTSGEVPSTTMILNVLFGK